MNAEKYTQKTLEAIQTAQSMALIQGMTDFFRLWKQIEDAHLRPLTGAKIDYALYEGKFVRSIAAPDKDCSTQELASALSDYITLFDKLLKGYLADRYSPHEIEGAYCSYLNNASLHI